MITLTEATRMSVDETNPSRRKFIANVAGSASALAAVGFGATDLFAQSAAAVPPQGGWDMTWVDRVTRAKHKQVFDAPGMADGMALTNAVVWLNGYAEVYKTTDADMAAVLVFRHKGLPLVLSDEIWAQMTYGEEEKINDPATNAPVKRNPFLKAAGGRAGASLMPGGDLESLIARGVIVLACNLALMRQAGALSKAMGITREQAQQKLIDAVAPGVVRMPSGVFATSRAEEAGCQFLRSS
ncbi:MAG TPA: hypothetical protein VGQ30_11010 [Gemmatimonadaceae bacterium]|nr:hypothetical protein [Gemmatimonadaceae bacterium]